MDTYLNYWRQLKMSERRLILIAFWLILAALVVVACYCAST